MILLRHLFGFALILTVTSNQAQATDSTIEAEATISPSSTFHIEGKIAPPDVKPKDWYWTTRILLDGGKRLAYLKVRRNPSGIFEKSLVIFLVFFKSFQEDNSFSISGLSSGSYLLEVHNPDYYYEPVRIDINSKGKVRARKVNNVQPSQVNQLQYPLRLKTQGRYKYFQTREEWKVTDMLMNPMVLMMVLPLLLITVLPKMMNDPETKKEMEQMQQQMNVNNQVTV